jgi:drug/metabolite transporter (DMT)-like permease
MKPPASSGRIEGSTIIGIGLMMGAIGLFTMLNGSVKWLTQSHDPLMVVWARNMGALAFMLAAFLPRHGMKLFRPNMPSAQIARGTYLLGSSVLYFFGLAHLDMASGAAIQLTGPLMVTALSAPLLAERVGWRRWLAVTIGFAGALIVIRPGVDMRWAALFFVTSAFCSTFYQITTRHLASYDTPATAATIAAIVGVVAMTPVAPFVWDAPEGWVNITLFCILGIFAGFGHFLLTSAYRYAGASTLAPFSYTHLLGAAIIGFILFGDFPDFWTWIGAGIIVSAGLYVAHRERINALREAVSTKAKTD